MPAATTLSTVFIAQACPVRWTKQACAINTVSLCSLETATFLAKVFRILIQVLSDLAASSTKSFTKFCRYIQHPSLSERYGTVTGNGFLHIRFQMNLYLHPTDSSFRQERVHKFHQISDASLFFYFPAVPQPVHNLKYKA